MTQFCENPTEPLRIQKLDNFRIAPHLHTSTEILYIQSGEVNLILGSLEYRMTKGDFAFIMASTLHSVSPISENTSYFVVDCKDEVIPDIIRRCSGLRPASPVLKAISVPDLLKYSFASLTSEKDKYIAFSLASLIATIIISKLRFTEIHDGVTSNLSNKILAYLGAHFSEQITLDSLANEMGVSRFHLSHLFANKLGIGFKEYLNNLRIEYAKGLLRSTDIPIYDICVSSGFENQRTFNRVFRDTVGASPRDYKLRREDFGVVPPKNEVLELNEDIETPQISEPENIIDKPLDIEIAKESSKATPKSTPKVAEIKNKPASELPVSSESDDPSHNKRKKKDPTWLF